MWGFDPGLYVCHTNAPPRATAQLSPPSVVPIAALMEMARMGGKSAYPI